MASYQVSASTFRAILSVELDRVSPIRFRILVKEFVQDATQLQVRIVLAYAGDHD